MSGLSRLSVPDCRLDFFYYTSWKLDDALQWSWSAFRPQCTLRWLQVLCRSERNG